MYKQETQVQGEQMENVVFHKNRNHNRFTSKKKRTEHGFQPYVTYLASKNEVSENFHMVLMEILYMFLSDFHKNSFQGINDCLGAHHEIQLIRTPNSISSTFNRIEKFRDPTPEIQF